MLNSIFEGATVTTTTAATVSRSLAQQQEIQAQQISKHFRLQIEHPSFLAGQRQAGQLTVSRIPSLHKKGAYSNITQIPQNQLSELTGAIQQVSRLRPHPSSGGESLRPHPSGGGESGARASMNYRDAGSAPLRKLSVDLILTYKHINEVRSIKC